MFFFWRFDQSIQHTSQDNIIIVIDRQLTGHIVLLISHVIIIRLDHWIKLRDDK